MSRKITPVLEPFVANIADVRMLAGVTLLVFHQFTFLFENRIAKLALVFTFDNINAIVLLDVSLTNETSFARFALKRQLAGVPLLVLQ